MTVHPKITGARVVATLPDAGPWRFTVFAGDLIAWSRTSGAYRLVNGALELIKPISDQPAPSVNAAPRVYSSP